MEHESFYEFLCSLCRQSAGSVTSCHLYDSDVGAVEVEVSYLLSAQSFSSSFCAGDFIS